MRRPRPDAALAGIVAATVGPFRRLDILVVNAGVGAYGPFLDLPAEDLEAMIDVNVKGALYAVRAALPELLKSDAADLVTIASEAGRRGLPYEATYCASKFAQVGLTRALDHELREHGIRCTNVCPGGVATDFAMGRGRTPDMPQLAGMMAPERRRRDGPVRAHPAAQPSHPRGRLPAGDRDVVGLSGAMTNLRWGILSTADIARKKVIPGMRKAARCEVVAIASRDAAQARRGGRRLGIPRAHGSYEALLADPDVDAVYIPLPNHLHAEWTIAAARAGKHVLCEKPLAMTAADAERMVDVCAAEGVRLMEAFMYRHHPSWVAADELVASGRIGRLTAVQSWFSYYNDDPANIRNISSMPAAARCTTSAATTSTCRGCCSAPSRSPSGPRSGATRRPASTSLTSAILEFDAGVATFTCSTRAETDQRVHVYGIDGRISIGIPFNIPPDRPTARPLTAGGDPPVAPATETFTFDIADPYTVEAERFAAAILDGTPTPTPPEDAVANLRVIERIFEAGGVASRPAAARPGIFVILRADAATDANHRRCRRVHGAGRGRGRRRVDPAPERRAGAGARPTSFRRRGGIVRHRPHLRRRLPVLGRRRRRRVRLRR